MVTRAQMSRNFQIQLLSVAGQMSAPNLERGQGDAPSWAAFGSQFSPGPPTLPPGPGPGEASSGELSAPVALFALILGQFGQDLDAEGVGGHAGGDQGEFGHPDQLGEGRAPSPGALGVEPGRGLPAEGQ